MNKLQLFLVFCIGTLVSCQQPKGDFTTYVEQSDFQRTPRYDETIEFSKRLANASRYAKFTTFGTSPQGRDLPLLIIDKNCNFTPEAVRKTDNAVLLVVACTHAGEPDGKDAGLIFLRDLLIHQKNIEILDNVTILFIPIWNVDGHEKFSALHRINQDGPDEVGTRLTAQRLNLNRDFVKADSPEMQYWLNLYHEWLPEFMMDIHVTNGADFQYVSTYGMDMRNLNVEENVRNWATTIFEPKYVEEMLVAGFPTFPYFSPFDWNNVDVGVLVGAYPPQFSNGYTGAMNRMGILIENHVYKPYEQRVRATYEMLRIVGEIMNKEHQSLRKSIALADQIVASPAFREKPMPLSHQTLRTDSVMIDFLGWAQKTDRSNLSGANWTRHDRNSPIVRQVGMYRTHEPQRFVQLPEAYIIKPECLDVMRIMDFHHIAYTRLNRDTTILVETYRFTNVQFGTRQNEGRINAATEYTTQMEEMFFPAGSLVVSMNQPRARVVAHILEPKGPTSLVHWGFFNAWVQPASEFFINIRYMEVKGREMLEQDSELRKTFEHKKATDRAFANDPQAILQFFMTELRKNVEPNANLYPIGRVLL
jgi:murein tripeptide amidase MpaA